jgi:hypothetical protein
MDKNIFVEVFNPGHWGVFKGTDRVGSVYRTVRPGLREWRVADKFGRTLFTSWYFKDAKENALGRAW